MAASEAQMRDANAVLEQRVTERRADLQAALAEVQAANRLKRVGLPSPV